MINFVARQQDGRDVIEIRAPRLDYSMTQDFKDLGERLIGPDSLGVIVNLAQVTFIDSKAIGALVSMRKRAAGRDIPFALCGLTSYVARIISVVTLNTIFDIYADEVEALLKMPRRVRP